jgi:hypothetical protein
MVEHLEQTPDLDSMAGRFNNPDEPMRVTGHAEQRSEADDTIASNGDHGQLVPGGHLVHGANDAALRKIRR